MLKSIYEIEFDPSGRFAAFATKFAAFQKELAKVPASWMKSGEAIKGNAEELAGMATARKLLADMERKSSTELTKHQQAASYTARSWQSTARSTKAVAGNIAHATTQLLKWTALTSVFTGLLGAGGLFGIDRLAASVGAGRRSSQGLGLSYGQQSAFGVNYGRLVDTGSFLSNVNKALHSAEGKGAFAGVGLGDQSGSTSDVGVRLLSRIKTIADEAPKGFEENYYRARQIDKFIGFEEFMRLKATSRGELGEIGRQFNKDVDPLSIGNRTAKLWQDLEVQLGRSGKMIENVFVTGLVGIAPKLATLSDAFQKAVAAFLASPQLKKSIDTLATGLEKLAGWISSISKGGGGDTAEITGAITGALLGARVAGIPGAAIGAVIGAGAAAKMAGDPIGLQEKPGHDTWNEAVQGAKDLRRPFGRWPDFMLNQEEKKKKYGSAISNTTTDHVIAKIMAAGYNREAATGIATGLYFESGRTWDPKAFNGAGGGRGAQGVGQWRGERISTFERMAGKSLMDATLDEQIDYKLYELSKGKDFGARRAGELLRSGKLSAKQAAEAFLNLDERPGPAGASEVRNSANLAESLMKKDASAYISNKPQSQSIVSSGKSDSDNLVNKFSRVLDDMSRRNGPGGQQTIKVAITPAPGGNPIAITQQAGAQ